MFPQEEVPNLTGATAHDQPGRRLARWPPSTRTRRPGAGVADGQDGPVRDEGDFRAAGPGPRRSRGGTGRGLGQHRLGAEDRPGTASCPGPGAGLSEAREASKVLRFLRGRIGVLRMCVSRGWFPGVWVGRIAYPVPALLE